MADSTQIGNAYSSASIVQFCWNLVGWCITGPNQEWLVGLLASSGNASL